MHTKGWERKKEKKSNKILMKLWFGFCLVCVRVRVHEVCCAHSLIETQNVCTHTRITSRLCSYWIWVSEWMSVSVRESNLAQSNVPNQHETDGDRMNEKERENWETYRPSQTECYSLFRHFSLLLAGVSLMMKTIQSTNTMTSGSNNSR